MAIDPVELDKAVAEALKQARTLIQADRDDLLACLAVHGDDGPIYDSLDDLSREELERYDGVLALIDAVMGKELVP